MAVTTDLPSFAYVPAVTSQIGPHPIRRQSKSLALTLTTTINDVVRIFQLPPNVKILNAGFFLDNSLDNGTGRASLQVTDGTTTKNIMTAITLNPGAKVTYDAYALATSPAVTGFESQASDWCGFVTTNKNFVFQLILTTAAVAPTAANIVFWLEYTHALESGEVSV